MAAKAKADVVYVRRVISRLESEVCESIVLQRTYGRTAKSAAAVAGLLHPILGPEPVEVFATLLLDGKHRVYGYAEVSRGTVTASLVHPREVFGPAVRCGAAAVIVAHNHPSGDPEPSLEDLEATRRLIAASKVLGIPLLDHLVVGADGSHSSLRERLDF